MVSQVLLCTLAQHTQLRPATPTCTPSFGGVEKGIWRKNNLLLSSLRFDVSYKNLFGLYSRVCLKLGFNKTITARRDHYPVYTRALHVRPRPWQPQRWLQSSTMSRSRIMLSKPRRICRQSLTHC